MPLLIQSVNNPLIKDMTKLHQKKHRDATGLFLVEGHHLHEEATKVGNVVHVFTTDESIRGDNVVTVTPQVLAKLAQTKNPQPVITICRKIEGVSVGNRVLLLERVQDPGNLGTLMRSALAFGFDTIVLDNTCDIYNDKVLRSTQGAIFRLNVLHQSIATFMEEHSELTFYGTAMEGTPLDDIDPALRIGLILGNEGSGVSSEVLAKTTLNLTIPMHLTESLNVAVAGSIIMHHLALK